jgi:proteasome lid subunit RPN8/RPN11
MSTPPAVTLPLPLWEEIVAHAREGKPEEICGILRGKGAVAFEAIRARNVAGERIENYTVDPQTLLRQFDFEDAGEEMMGIYHSHPVSVAEPSATDAWNAHYPEAVYFICSLEFDAQPVIRAWRLEDAGVALDWDALRAALPFREVRPGLWGHLQPAGAPLPPVLAETEAAACAAPYYLVFATEPDGALVEGRLVTVRECAVETPTA